MIIPDSGDGNAIVAMDKDKLDKEGIDNPRLRGRKPGVQLVLVSHDLKELIIPDSGDGNR